MAEFEEQMRSSSDGRDLQSVARDMTQAVTDPDIQATEVSYMWLVGYHTLTPPNAIYV